MKRNLYDMEGMPLLRLPSAKNDKANEKRRDVADLDQTTAAHMISITGICPDAPMILCGRHNKAFPVLRQLIKMSPMPYLLIGTRRDLDDSCLRLLGCDWESDAPEETLPAGNGVMTLRPGAATNLALKEYISGWDNRLIIMCLGSGLQVDSELLNLLNGVGSYILLAESLNRSVKGSDGCRLTPAEVLSSMDYILVSSIGSAVKELMSVIPSYECEKVTNTSDFSLHRDSPQMHTGGYHHRNGGGFRLSQSRVLETKAVFTQDDLTHMQDNNIMMIYNACAAHTWVARIAT